MAKIKTLVISNDPVMLRFLQQNLNGNEYEVVSTQHTGEELKAVVEHELPDLIILDIMMPGLDGIEICLRIRQWCQTPIVMLSAWGVGEDKVRGLNLGAESYLTEAFGIDVLKTGIKETLQRNQAAINSLPNASLGAPWER